MTWIVHTKGSYLSPSFEIAVIRDTNLHGLRSYGWFDGDKLLISHNGGPCTWPVIPFVWECLIEAAQKVADELNRGEEPR